MKKTIKTLILLLVVTNTFAIDRIVQENGATGTYATISAAITAAINGDRIIIHPKIGDNPYVENIIIDKTLELASAQDGVRYKIQGSITLTAANNRNITIIGAHITTGTISGTSTTGWRTNVNIMGSLIEGGDISFNNQYYASIVSNILQNGSITIAHGKIIGNELVNEYKIISVVGSGSIPNDTVNIIANKTGRIFCSSDIFLNIYNNFIKIVNGTASTINSIEYTFTSTASNKLNIFNNTILTSSSSSFFNFFLNLKSPALVKNNIFQKSNVAALTPAFSFGSGVNITASKNYYNSSFDIPTENNPTHVTTGPSSLASGILTLPTPAQNGADPSFEFYDLDLTVGDAGCYGGSYTLDNYFPITGSSRVYNIDMPFGIITTGAPLNIKADGFDR
jgi:hypothetical protein